jgi:hypothetical protein
MTGHPAKIGRPAPDAEKETIAEMPDSIRWTNFSKLEFNGGRKAQGYFPSYSNFA